MTDHWTRSYIGLPYRSHGRDRGGVDCWGLVGLVYEEQLGIRLPSYAGAYVSAAEKAEIAAAIATGRAEGGWLAVEAPRAFDVAVFRSGRHESHVGLVVDRERILHVKALSAAAIEPLSAPHLGARLTGYWRHEASIDGPPLPVRTAVEPISNSSVLIGRGIEGLQRVEVTVPAGATIAEIVAIVLPGVVDPASIRVQLATERGCVVVDPAHWARVRPRPGVSVVVRTVAAGQALRTILMIVVMIAAVAFGQWYAPALAGTFGIAQAGWAAILTTTAAMAGGLLLNALIPMRSPKKERENYTISGLRNQVSPDAPIPAPLGRLRMAPVYAAPPYSEMVGDVQYVHVLFCWGYGPLTISGLRIGETAISDYDEVQIETREGWPGDPMVTLYPQQVIEDQLGVELTRAWQRNDDGSYTPGGTAIEKPVIRVTASDTAEVSVIIAFPTGLISISGSGTKRSRLVPIRIRQRLVGSETWTEVTTLQISAKAATAIWRQHRWTLPSRGAWEIELTRMSPEAKDQGIQDKAVWQYLQSWRPEYPLAFDRPLALTAMRLKATAQLNGSLDNITGIGSRIALDWDVASGTWILRETRSPAALFRWVLQGPAAAYPVTDAEIDLDLLADWSAWCASKGLEYDRVHDHEASLEEVLGDIAAVGRATPRHDGRRWGVVIDRPQTLVVDEINPRNSKDFRWSRAYPKKPDGFRIKFPDRTNDFRASERIVPWPGHTGDVVVTEAIDLPGVTNPDQIWIAARRRQYEIEHRPDLMQATQYGLARVATRGDLVALSHDVLDRVVQAGRVRSSGEGWIVVDEEIGVGSGWAARFRVFEGDDPIGRSVVAPVLSGVGPTHMVRIGGADHPKVDALVMFGPISRVSLLCRVRGQERGEGDATIQHLVAAAPEIDILTDAEEPPPWDGRIGAPGPVDITPPAVPVITSISSGVDATGDPNGLDITLQPGLGSTASLRSYEVDHRLVGGTTWTTTLFAASDGGGALPGHVKGDDVEMRARAVSLAGVAGSWTATVHVVIGAGDLVVPVPTSLAIAIQSSTSRRISVGLPASTADIQIVGYRVRARPGAGWLWADMMPLVSGYLTSSPYDTADPRPSGAWSFAAVAVSSAGLESTAVSVEATLTAAADLLASRIERALGWPGTKTGGTVVSSDLVATATTNSTVVYTTPTIDLGSDKAITVDAVAYGLVGVATLTMRTGLAAGSGTLGTAGPLGSTTARYVQITVSVASAAQARIGDLVTAVHS